MKYNLSLLVVFICTVSEANLCEQLFENYTAAVNIIEQHPYYTWLEPYFFKLQSDKPKMTAEEQRNHMYYVLQVIDIKNQAGVLSISDQSHPISVTQRSQMALERSLSFKEGLAIEKAVILRNQLLRHQPVEYHEIRQIAVILREAGYSNQEIRLLMNYYL